MMIQSEEFKPYTIHSLGMFDNEIVLYDPEYDMLICKEQKYSAKDIHNVFRSDLDRDKVKNTDLTITKNINTVRLGCLEDTVQQYKTLLKKRNAILNKYNKLKTTNNY